MNGKKATLTMTKIDRPALRSKQPSFDKDRPALVRFFFKLNLSVRNTSYDAVELLVENMLNCEFSQQF